MIENDRAQHQHMSRRDALRVGAAVVASAVLPSAAIGTTSVNTPVPVVRRVSSGIVPKLRQLRREFDAAFDAYRSTGATELIESLRFSARNKLGYALALEPRNDEERALFREAGKFLDVLETSFPDVSISAEMSARYKKLRAWAEEGGQYAGSEVET